MQPCLFVNIDIKKKIHADVVLSVYARGRLGWDSQIPAESLRSSTLGGVHSLNLTITPRNRKGLFECVIPCSSSLKLNSPMMAGI